MVNKMDKIFLEIFGCYYKTITDIINNAPLTEEEVQKIIRNNGFSESFFHLLPILNELPFIEKKGDKYYSLLKNKIRLPLTTLEKSWLKVILDNKRIKLFNNEIKENIDNIEPLYKEIFFKFFDRYSDGDDYSSNEYISNYRKITEALKNKEIIEITYKPLKQKEEITGYYLPTQIEYSNKDDKFRFFAARIFNNKIVDYVCINIGRIKNITKSNQRLENIEKLEKYIKKFEKKEVIELEIYNKRNAIERFMIEFSTYEKQSIFNQENETCKAKIFYRKNEEYEILMKILSFGPVIKILTPCPIKDKIIEKINTQFKLNKIKR